MKGHTFSVKLIGNNNEVRLSCVGSDARQAYATYLQAFAELLTVEGNERIETTIDNVPVLQHFDLLLEDMYI